MESMENDPKRKSLSKRGLKMMQQECNSKALVLSCIRQMLCMQLLGKFLKKEKGVALRLFCFMKDRRGIRT